MILNLVSAFIIGYQLIKGLRKGFTQILIEMMMLVFGIVVGLKNFELINQYVAFYFPINANYIFFISIALIWLSIIVLTFLLNSLVNFFTNQIGLGFVNYSLGACLGALKGFVILVPIFMGIKLINPELIKDAYLYPYVSIVSQFASSRFNLLTQI